MPIDPIKPVPAVRVRKVLRKPISPRVGIRYSRRTPPFLSYVISSISPRRLPSASVTAPRFSSRTSTACCCTGSMPAPCTLSAAPVHRQMLDRLHALAVDPLPQLLRAGHRELVARASHRLDQHREMELT